MSLYGSFSPHKTSPARHPPAHLLRRAGRALLEDQRAREPALDVQRRQPAAGDGTVSRSAARDQAGCDLDDTGTIHLVYLRSAAVESVSQLDTRARRRIDRGDDRAQQSTHGSKIMALGIGLVPDGPTRLAFCDARSPQREPRTRNATRLGTSVCVVLDFLAGADSDYCCGVVVVGAFPVEYLASGRLRNILTEGRESLLAF